MPQRNGQNPIRAVHNYGHAAGVSGTFGGESKSGSSGAVAGICAACKTEVPPKPGFRISALKCPKCGQPLGKK